MSATKEITSKLNDLIYNLDRLDIQLDLPSSEMTIGEYEDKREELIESCAKSIIATVGVGTCKVDVLNTGDCAGYECSEYIMHCNRCHHEYGYVQYNEDGDVWMSEPPKFCPNCGRRIEES